MARVKMASTAEQDKTVKLSEEYYEYLVAIAADRRRPLKSQLEVIILDWMERHGWEAS